MATSELPPLIIAQGEQRLIHLNNILKYSIGGSAIRVHPTPHDKNALIVKGAQIGVSDLWIWKNGGTTEHRTIYVEKTFMKEKNLDLQRALSRLEETEVILSGEGVILRGEVKSIQEASRIAGLLEGFSNVKDELDISPRLLGESRQKLEIWLKTKGNASAIKIDLYGDRLRVKGTVNSPHERSLIIQKVKAIFPLIRIQLVGFPDDDPTIHFKVFLLEVRKTKFRSLGISWPSSISNAFNVSKSGIKQSLALDLAIEALEGDGSAKILSKPELVVRAPGEAELFAGGELPVRVQTRFTSNISWKPYGLTLRLKVTTASVDKVRLEIQTEVSHLNPNLTEDPIPGLNANRLKTQVDAIFGEPLFLSGLLQDGIRQQARGLPFIRQIPVLGSLFSSDDFLNERSELVAILVPNLSPPDSPIDKFERVTPKGTPPLPRNWISPEEEMALRTAEEFPWNAVQ